VNGQEKVPTVPIGEEAEWASEPVWMILRSENFWPYRDQTPDPSPLTLPACSQSPYQLCYCAALVGNKCKFTMVSLQQHQSSIAFLILRVVVSGYKKKPTVLTSEHQQRNKVQKCFTFQLNHNCGLNQTRNLEVWRLPLYAIQSASLWIMVRVFQMDYACERSGVLTLVATRILSSGTHQKSRLTFNGRHGM
jgi:hypothetical protein